MKSPSTQCRWKAEYKLNIQNSIEVESNIYNFAETAPAIAGIFQCEKDIALLLSLVFHPLFVIGLTSPQMVNNNKSYYSCFLHCKIIHTQNKTCRLLSGSVVFNMITSKGLNYWWHLSPLQYLA